MATYQIRTNDGCTAKIRLKGHIESKTFYPAGGRTARQHAEKWANAEEDKIRAGNYQSRKKARTITLREALDNYEKNFASKLKGYIAEKYRITGWRNWKYSNAKLSDLTEDMFNAYRDERRKYVKDGTIRLDFAVITALFSNTNYGIPNPASGTISTLDMAKQRDRRLKKDEQPYLLDALFNTNCSDPKRANQYLPLVVIFGIETSCRLSEIVEDKKEHSTGVLRENVHFDGDKSTVFIKDTKNGRDRFVPLTPVAIEAIKRALELDSSTTGPVFRTTASAITQAWGRAKIRAIAQYKHDGGTDESFLVDFHFHDLRHEAASRWKKDLQLAELKDLTGHKDVRSLFRYLHSDEDDIKDVASVMTAIQNRNREMGDRRVIQFPEKKYYGEGKK